MAQGTTDSKVGVTKNITTAITEATEDIMVVGNRAVSLDRIVKFLDLLHFHEGLFTYLGTGMGGICL